MLGLEQISKHLIWKDELNDRFVLTSFGEIYPSPYGLENLRVVTWSKNLSARLQKTGVILKEDCTDDPLWLLDFPVQKMPQIMALNTLKRRPHIGGKWIKDKEKRLGHKILAVRKSKTLSLVK